MAMSTQSFPPSAVAMLRVLSMLDGESIPEDILYTGMKDVKLKDYPKDHASYCDAREMLTSSMLVLRDSQIGILKIGRRVQDAVRQSLGNRDSEVFQDIFNTTAQLLAAIWPFLDHTTLYKVDRLRKAQYYLPHVRALKSIIGGISGASPNRWRPEGTAAALFNEASWFHMLSSGSKDFDEGAAFVNYSRWVLDRIKVPFHPVDSQHLANLYRNEGIIEAHIDGKTAVINCQEWIKLLTSRIQSYRDQGDMKTLPIAYNEVGVALMRASDEGGALEAWSTACETLRQHQEPGTLPFPFPWMHRALITAFSGDPDTAYSIISPILEEREMKLGVDDTRTLETGLLLNCIGTVRYLQGLCNEAYELDKRAVSVLRETMGENSRWTMKAYYRLARDLFDREEYDEAADLLRKCASFARGVSWYNPEAARAAWKLSRALQAGAKSNEDLELGRHRTYAMLLRKGLRKRLPLWLEYEEEQLSDADWDKLVFYYFR